LKHSRLQNRHHKRHQHDSIHDRAPTLKHIHRVVYVAIRRGATRKQWIKSNNNTPH
jgi:hypothetical protein